MPADPGSFLEVLRADSPTADRADKMAAYDRLHAGPETMTFMYEGAARPA
jgi:hypothetical protein